MKKDKNNNGSDKRKMSRLERENAKPKAQNGDLKADNKQLRSDLSEVLTLFEEIMTILKCEGLSEETAARCKTATSKNLLPGSERTRRLGELIYQYLYKEVSLLLDGNKAHSRLREIGRANTSHVIKWMANTRMTDLHKMEKGESKAKSHD